MIPHLQRVKHDPDNGTYGDCLRTCLASILDIANPGDVPHFLHDGCSGERADSRARDWLLSRQLAPLFLPFSGLEPLQAVLNAWFNQNPGMYYMLGCGHGAARTDHFVIGYEDAIVHNPAWIHGELFPHSGGQWTIVTFVPSVLLK